MRHIQKGKSRLMPRVILIGVLVALISVGSVVTVVANTAEVVVEDRGQSYAFSLIGTKPEDIVARAVSEGMPALTEADKYTFSKEEGVLRVTRSVRVSLTADGTTETFQTFEGTALSAVLAENNIAIGARDVISPAADTVVTADTDVTITRSNRVFVQADGTRRMVDVLGGTTGDALAAAGVTLEGEDTVSPAADTALQNGMRITVKRAMRVTVTADGETAEQSLSAATVQDALTASGVTLGELDRVLTNGKTAKPSDLVADGMEISVVRVKTEEVTVEEAVDFETTYNYSDEMYEDESVTDTEGVEGRRRAVYEVTYANGEEESRALVKEEILSEPKNAVVTVGTQERPASGGITVPDVGDTGSGLTFTDASGQTVSYAWSTTGSATAYTAPPGAITSVGATAQPGYVAVDPSIIPYGSLLYITSPYGTWDYGYCYAMDTGGAAMAGDIVADLYYSTYDECAAFGRRDMTVYVIRMGY